MRRSDHDNRYHNISFSLEGIQQGRGNARASIPAPSTQTEPEVKPDARPEWPPDELVRLIDANDFEGLRVKCKALRESPDLVISARFAKAGNIVLRRVKSPQSRLLNEVDRNGRTPLNRALETSNFEAVRILASYGADATASNKYIMPLSDKKVMDSAPACPDVGRNAITFCVARNNLKAFAVLKAAYQGDGETWRRALNERDGNGDTPLTLACKEKFCHGFYDELRYAGADLSICDKNGIYPDEF